MVFASQSEALAGPEARGQRRPQPASLPGGRVQAYRCAPPSVPHVQPRGQPRVHVSPAWPGVAAGLLPALEEQSPADGTKVGGRRETGVKEPGAGPQSPTSAAQPAQ